MNKFIDEIGGAVGLTLFVLGIIIAVGAAGGLVFMATFPYGQ
jgi:hypothetical protein